MDDALPKDPGLSLHRNVYDLQRSIALKWTITRIAEGAGTLGPFELAELATRRDALREALRAGAIS